MTYKPEIDGLRAVAVLLVLLCHMQLGFMGGFIGVDVFFVISGFLITTIVVNGIAQDHFSFWSFYARRFVRLYPALIVVVLLTFIAGFLLVSPTFLEAITRSGKYALASHQCFFQRQPGYFDVAAQGRISAYLVAGVECSSTCLAFAVWMALKALQICVMGHAAGYPMPRSSPRRPCSNQRQCRLLTDALRAFELGIGALLGWF